MLPKSTTKQLTDLVHEIESVDQLSQVVLKGHLVLEQALVRIISTFVHHPDHLPSRLQFAQRVSIARSMSLDQADNSMWKLVLALNKLRNTLAHSLDSEARKNAYKSLKQAYEFETPAANRPLETAKPHEVATLAVAHCLGFLHGFESEVDRFKAHVETLDRAANPHRFGNTTPPCS